MRRRYRRHKPTTDELDGRDGARQAMRADAAFSARMRAAMRAGRENPFAAAASAVKPAPWRPKRLRGIAERSYCGSPSAWSSE